MMMQFKTVLFFLLLTSNSILVAEEAPIFCNIAQGFRLLSQESYSPAQIEMILNACDKITPNAPKVLLLHGLFARKQAQGDEHYTQAIEWLKKAVAAAPPDDLSAHFELATTYEWAQDLSHAAEVYQAILTQFPTNRAALLGMGRIYRLDSRYSESNAIYQQLLTLNPQDTDALNGLGWLNASEKNINKAADYFQKTLGIDSTNSEALKALAQIKASTIQPLPESGCGATQGLALLNQTNPPLAQIKTILALCDKEAAKATDTLLLHGLLARFQGRENKNYRAAIRWLEQARASAGKDNFAPALELALTYEWSNLPARAEDVYLAILAQAPKNRAALIGQARVLRVQSETMAAAMIYQQLLKENPQDTDALNGMGWVKLAEQDRKAAARYFAKALTIQPGNKEAEVGLTALEKKPAAPVIAASAPLCEADQGLMLLNQKNPNLKQIKLILQRCDSNTPNARSALLLHGLLARVEAKNTTNDFEPAIRWLKKAIQASPPNDRQATLELGLTYEWADNPKEAMAIYLALLNQSPQNRGAILGKARVLRMEYKVSESIQVYRQLLNANPRDIEAINGLGQSFMANYQFKESRQEFDKALALNPGNEESLSGLNMLRTSTKYFLSVTGGNYSVPPEVSNGLNLYFFENLNATDGLTILATHNTKQIGENFFAGPTLLPNNSLLLGFQRAIPKRYGWSLSYDYRQHNGLADEQRIIGTANLYLTRDLEWFNGIRTAYPSPWKGQLYFSGLTLFTTTPVDLSFTGFWANQQFGGASSSYSFDLSKEYDSRLYYNMGLAYSPTIKNWEIHGKIIWPTFFNQAFVGDFSHYFFNNSTFINAGWRVYWG